jgi:hypothetical protein
LSLPRLRSAELTARVEVRAAIATAFPDWALALGPDHIIDLKAFGAIGADRSGSFGRVHQHDRPATAVLRRRRSQVKSSEPNSTEG